MTERLSFFALPGNEGRTQALALMLDGEIGSSTIRRFPDGESYVRIGTDVANRELVAICTLDRPDDKLLPLLFLVATARDLGVRRIGLVAPYLAYMRQDRRFSEGEGITSAYFARILSQSIDWLVTVDPHLHRRSSLSEIYSVPSATVHAAPHISAWIRENVHRPLLVGPDVESEQWVHAVALDAGAPAIVLQKSRRGDRDVEVSVPTVAQWREHTPVLVDDIISTARTMIETVGHLRRAGLAAPICIGVHAVFCGSAYDDLLAAGAARVVTANTISHASNVIDLTAPIAEKIRLLMRTPSSRSA